MSSNSQRPGSQSRCLGTGANSARPRRKDKEVRIYDVFQVLVECRTVDEQRELYEALVAQGRKCRLIGT